MRLLAAAAVAAVTLSVSPAVAQQPADAAPAAAPSQVRPGEEPDPTEQMLGVPIYPAARFLRSFDAGRGQRYYLFGTQASFAEIVAYYRTLLRQRGVLIFERPATHTFDIGRYRADAVAFTPGVTVKDFTWGGATGFPNPHPREQPDRFPTVIQIVPPPGQLAR